MWVVESVQQLGSHGFFFSSRGRHTRCSRDWSSDVCSSDLVHDLVEVQETVQSVGYPDRIVYALTDAGREAAREWLREMRSEERRVGKECRSRWTAHT